MQLLRGETRKAVTCPKGDTCEECGKHIQPGKTAIVAVDKADYTQKWNAHIDGTITYVGLAEDPAIAEINRRIVLDIGYRVMECRKCASDLH